MYDKQYFYENCSCIADMRGNENYSKQEGG